MFSSYPSHALPTLWCRNNVPCRMKLSAGFKVGMGTVLALGGPAQSFHAGIGSRGALEGLPILPKAGRTSAQEKEPFAHRGHAARGPWHEGMEESRRHAAGETCARKRRAQRWVPELASVAGLAWSWKVASLWRNWDAGMQGCRDAADINTWMSPDAGQGNLCVVPVTGHTATVSFAPS